MKLRYAGKTRCRTLPRLLTTVLVSACSLPAVAHAQPVRTTLFDEAQPPGAAYHDASHGTVTGDDFLELSAEGKLPIENAHAVSGAVSGRLAYRHTGGSWTLVLEPPEHPVDLAAHDSLILYLNAPEDIPGLELPRIGIEDASGSQTALLGLSAPQNVRVDPEQTGFTEESPTDARLSVRYVSSLPADLRRPGYPEDLTVTFDDVPRDTSQPGIGAPAVPARFDIATGNGVRLDFRFRDVDADGTLSASGEYIEVLIPESQESARLSAVWRIELSSGQDPTSVQPPGAGDVFRLVLSYDEFTVDGDPSTWQRLSLPLSRIFSDQELDRASISGLVFANGGLNPETRTLWIDGVQAVANDDEAFLEMVQRATFDFFWFEANPANGLVRDRSTTSSPASIAAVGFGLSALTVGIDRGWITREEGRDRVLATLRFFWNAPQSTAINATGYRGFFYHFLDMQTGRRAWTSELSTVDTALLIAGVLHMRQYFSEEGEAEAEIRTLADAIYERIDWEWMQFRHPTDPSAAISHGWYPDPAGRSNADAQTGFIRHDWLGYNEAMILYILALGSPTHPVGSEAWDRWVSGYGSQWQTQYGYTFLTFPPLFGHQYSHVWIDFRWLQDAYMREKGIDYFENSRRATLAQRAYHIANPRGWPNYGPDEWGLTASDTPTGYAARGAPPAQNDDGTLVPTAPGGSIAFTPEESTAALRHMYQTYGTQLFGQYGFRDAYNASVNWFDPAYLGIDQGPILLMIENLRTEAIWDSFMGHEAIQRGLRNAGFQDTTNAEQDPSEDQTAIAVSLYPNPAASHAFLRVRVAQAGAVQIELFDVLGRNVAPPATHTVSAGTSEISLPIGSLAPGVYFVRVGSEENSSVRSFAVVR